MSEGRFVLAEARCRCLPHRVYLMSVWANPDESEPEAILRWESSARSRCVAGCQMLATHCVDGEVKP